MGGLQRGRRRRPRQEAAREMGRASAKHNAGHVVPGSDAALAEAVYAQKDTPGAPMYIVAQKGGWGRGPEGWGALERWAPPCLPHPRALNTPPVTIVLLCCCCCWPLSPLPPPPTAAAAPRSAHQAGCV